MLKRIVSFNKLPRYCPRTISSYLLPKTFTTISPQCMQTIMSENKTSRTTATVVPENMPRQKTLVRKSPKINPQCKQYLSRSRGEWLLRKLKQFNIQLYLANYLDQDETLEQLIKKLEYYMQTQEYVSKSNLAFYDFELSHSVRKYVESFGFKVRVNYSSKGSTCTTITL